MNNTFCWLYSIIQDGATLVILWAASFNLCIIFKIKLPRPGRVLMGNHLSMGCACNPDSIDTSGISLRFTHENYSEFSQHFSNRTWPFLKWIRRLRESKSLLILFLRINGSRVYVSWSIRFCGMLETSLMEYVRPIATMAHYMWTGEPAVVALKLKMAWNQIGSPIWLIIVPHWLSAFTQTYHCFTRPSSPLFANSWIVPFFSALPLLTSYRSCHWQHQRSYNHLRTHAT